MLINIYNPRCFTQLLCLLFLNVCWSMKSWWSFWLENLHSLRTCLLVVITFISHHPLLLSSSFFESASFIYLNPNELLLLFSHIYILFLSVPAIRRVIQGFTSSAAAKVSALTSWRRSPRLSSSLTTSTWWPTANMARRLTGRGTAWLGRWRHFSLFYTQSCFLLALILFHWSVVDRWYFWDKVVQKKKKKGGFCWDKFSPTAEGSSSFASAVLQL